MVLLRFLDRSDGRVSLSGHDGQAVDLCDLAGDDVRTVVGLLAQDAHIFDSTIWENVRLARPQATPAEVREALRRAGLLDWVDRLPDGLDTWVGEHGERMSGGERQRLALARALLATSCILVLSTSRASTRRCSNRRRASSLTCYTARADRYHSGDHPPAAGL